MATGRKIGYVSAFLALLPLIFSSPIYAQEQTKENNPRKNIEVILKEEYKKDNKSKPKNSISLREYLFLSRPKGLSNGAYSEIAYETPVTENERLSVELAAGYMALDGKDVNRIRKEKLEVIEINVGPKYNLIGPLYIKGGVSFFKYHLDSVRIPPEWGGYVGIGASSSKDKNPSFSFEIRQQFGDLDINYPLLEDETNIAGQLIGGGISYRW